MQNLKTEQNSKFGDVARIRNGFAFKRVDFKTSGVPLVRQSNLDGERVNLTKAVYLPEEYLRKYSSFILRKGDILLGMSGSLGKLCIYDLDEPALQNQRTGKVEIINPDKLNERYFWYFLNTLEPKFQANARGSGILNISSSDIEGLDFYLPDKKEQMQEVKKLDIALPKVASSLSGIVKARKLVKKFRQAILTAAVTGKLTEDWREKNPQPSIEIFIEELKQKRLTEAKTPTNKETIQHIYSFAEENHNEDLPEEWRFMALQKLCSSFTYGTSSKSSKEGDVAVLRMGNLQKGEIDWSDLVYTSDKKEIEKYKLNAGDVLFNRTNSPELVGKTSIFRGERDAIYAGYLIKINNYPLLNSEYLNYCLNTQYAKDFCYQQKTDGVSQSNINAQKLGKFEVPFCSPEEQKEIVRRVNEYFEIADKVEKQIEAAENKVSKLTQAILAKTFNQG